MTDTSIEERLKLMAAEQARQAAEQARVASEQTRQGGQLSRVMLVVFGSPDVDAEPITKQVTELRSDLHISQTDVNKRLDQIVSRLDSLAAERAIEKKILGMLGIKDLPTIIALVLAIYALGGKVGLWK